ncbi:metallophosphoesterase family protein [soil metagenome]
MGPAEPQRLVYAIGDIHGRLDLLEETAAAIEAHRDGRPATLVFLGDYVDRGPDSRGVIDWLIRAQAEQDVICLKGNHEALMIMSLRAHDREAEAMWMSNGGVETLTSYEGHDPEDHLDWIDSLPLYWQDGHRIYVHAGLFPSVRLDAQSEESCLWIRQRFLRAIPAELPGHVVHGHTPKWDGKPDPSEPELLAHRTNLDTGAYFTGVLTVGVFDRDKAGGPTGLLMTAPLIADRSEALATWAREAELFRRRRSREA